MIHGLSAAGNPCGPTDPAGPLRHGAHQSRAAAPAVSRKSPVGVHHGVAHDQPHRHPAHVFIMTRWAPPSVALNIYTQLP